MSERIDDDGELFENSAQRDLWSRMEGLSQAEPGLGLRQRVLNDLNHHSQPKRPWWALWLPTETPQWAGLMVACGLGVAMGLLLVPDSKIETRMAQLESQLNNVNQQLLISRLTASSPSERLAAVLQAGTLGQRDATVASALLQRAAIDEVPSVRSAALGALGDEINQSQTAEQVFALLEANDSPIVQMAIVDLVLRHGDLDLLAQLKQRVDTGVVHPALSGYVEEALGAMEI